MDVDGKDYRHEPEAPTTAVELSMDDNFAEDDDYQDTMSDTTEWGLEKEKIERDERQTQSRELRWDVGDDRVGSLDFNGGWSESEGTTEYNPEEMQVASALAPKVCDWLLGAIHLRRMSAPEFKRSTIVERRARVQ